MFKAMNNLKDRKGFTLIELLIVIAIIGILAAIAIPAFLGQREKARQRALESSCRSAVTEVQTAIDDTISGTAQVFMTLPDTQTCYQNVASPARLQCAVLYPTLTSILPYTNLSTILTAIITHHNTGKEERSPYTGNNLFAPLQSGATPTAAAGTGLGQCLIINSNDTSAKILGYSPDGVVIFNTPVSSL